MTTLSPTTPFTKGYILRTDRPFRGIAESLLLDDGTVAWSGGLTPDQYAKERGFPVEVVDNSEFGRRHKAYIESLVTAPRAETRTEFDYALGVLPPARWRNAGDVEMFHVSERIVSDLVSWHARIGDRCFTFDDHSSKSHDDVAAAARAALKRVDALLAEGAEPRFTGLAPEMLASLKRFVHLHEKCAEARPDKDPIDATLADSGRELIREIAADKDPDAVFDKAKALYGGLCALYDRISIEHMGERPEDVALLQRVEKVLNEADYWQPSDDDGPTP